MEIAELRERRVRLEREIAEAIERFESETGTIVSDLKYDRRWWEAEGTDMKVWRDPRIRAELDL